MHLRVMVITAMRGSLGIGYRRSESKKTRTRWRDVTLAVVEKTLPMATITGRTDRQTDGQTDRVRRNMRPPPREEGRIIMGYRMVKNVLRYV